MQNSPKHGLNVSLLFVNKANIGVKRNLRQQKRLKSNQTHSIEEKANCSSHTEWYWIIFRTEKKHMHFLICVLFQP